jgi:hypothetical protein
MSDQLPRGVPEEPKEGLRTKEIWLNQAVYGTERCRSAAFSRKSPRGWGKLALQDGFSANF